MARITGELDLSGVATDNYDSKLGLRVAVFRNGKQLGSTDLDAPATPAGRVPFAVDFEPVTVVGVRIPCPVTVVIGPQLSASELLAIDTIQHVVNFAVHERTGSAEAVPSTARRRTRSAEETADAINIGSVAVDPNIYLCWIYCCQTYTIRGRLVCREWIYNSQTKRWSLCDNPVPGATVSIYDVHCFFWWCWRNLIGTATTDFNGNFVFTFRWCCFRWLPWLDPAWILDETLYRQISRLLADAHLPLPPNPPGPGPDPAILQSIVAGASRFSRSAPAALRSSASPTFASPNSLSRETLLSVLPASPELEALHVWPWWPWYDCGPNIVFEATQICRDRLETVYSETNAQARWDIGTNTSVTLVATDLACCRQVCHEPPCPECLVFTWVCNGITADQISTSAGSAGPPPLPDLRGYAD